MVELARVSQELPPGLDRESETSASADAQDNPLCVRKRKRWRLFLASEIDRHYQSHHARSRRLAENFTFSSRR
jgi:hypothetical protein